MTASTLSRSSIALRSSIDSDVPFLRHLYRTTREDEMRLVAWTPEQKAAFVDMQFHAQKTHYEQQYPDCDFLVIELEGQPIGRLYIDRGDDILITDITLLPDFRGRGIGRMLMQEILAEGRSTGKRVSIHVERFNPALRLYERLGFRQVEDRGVYLFLEWRSDD